MAHRLLICAGLAEDRSVIDRVDRPRTYWPRPVRWRHWARGSAGRGPGCGGRLRRPPDSPDGPVDCGESGSTLRFFIPLLAGCGRPVRLLGHGRLMQRPQDVYARLFERQGLPFSQTQQELTLCGPLRPGSTGWRGGVSSQFISGLLLALPLLDGDSVLQVTPPFESQSYVALTLRAMADFGVSVRREVKHLFHSGNQRYRPGTARWKAMPPRRLFRQCWAR